MLKVFVVHGPNLNLLGHTRAKCVRFHRPSMRSTRAIESEAGRLGMEVEIHQTSHEGGIIELLHEGSIELPGR